MNTTCHYTASGIVLDRDRVLLVEHAKTGWWMPPGGHVEPGETLPAAAEREVREETGLDCEIIAAPGFEHPTVQILPAPLVMVVTDVPEDGAMIKHMGSYYVMRPTLDPDAVIPQEEEITNWRWVPISEVANLPVFPGTGVLVRAAAQFADALVAA